MEMIRVAQFLERSADYNPRYFTPTEEQRKQLDELSIAARLIRLAYAEGYAAGVVAKKA